MNKVFKYKTLTKVNFSQFCCVFMFLATSLLNGCGHASPHYSKGSPNPSFTPANIKKSKISTQIAGVDTQTNTTERWVIEGAVTVSVPEVTQTLTQLREKLKTLNSIMSDETVQTQSRYGHALLVVKLPPDQLPHLMSWLKENGEITQQHISREEVSAQLLTYKVTIRNATTTLKRLEEFIKKDTLSVNEVLKVEEELRRLREVIEQNESAQELLKSQVARATLKITITEQPKRLPRAPKARFYVGGRPSLYLNDKAQLGWGLSLFNPDDPAHFHLDVDFIPDADTTIIKLGSASYSDFFGAGQRHFLNPHIGFELGYVNESQIHHFAFGATAGIELLRFKYAFVNARFTGLGLIGEEGLKTRMITGIDFAIVY